MGKRTAVASRPRTAPRARAVTDVMDSKLEAAQRFTVAAVVVLSVLALWRPLPDPFILPKLTAIVLGGVVLLAFAAVRAVRRAQVSVPTGPAAWIAAAFAVALVIATLTADNIVLAAVGNHSRYGGLLSYATYLVFFLVALRLFAAPTSSRPVVLALLAAMTGVTAYGLLQIAGLDPFVWVTSRDEVIFSTLGNTNFAGAYIALVLPVAAAVLLLSGWSRNRRLLVAAVAVPSVAYMLATAASQAVLAAAAGLLVVAVAWALARRRAAPGGSKRRPPAWVGWAAAGAAVVVLIMLGLLAMRVASDVADSYAERLQFWQAALAIAADHPVVGTGLDSFRDYFPRYRPEAHAVLRDYQITDSTHNAFLGMLSNGGLLLGLTYLAFVGWTGWTLLRGLRTAAPDRMLVLGAFGGIWAGYQVQSLVSVDVPPLAFLHFLSAGVIIATAAALPVRSWSLPLPQARPAKLLARPGAERRPLAVAGLTAVLLVGLVAAWTATRPLRADLAAAGGRGEAPPRALAAADRAVRLAPWEAEYRIMKAQAHLAAGDDQGAYDAAAAAAELRSGSSKLAIGNLDLAVQTGDQAGASRWVERALERDPHNPLVLERAATYFQSQGDSARAAQLATRAEQLRSRYGGT